MNKSKSVAERLQVDLVTESLYQRPSASDKVIFNTGPHSNEGYIYIYNTTAHMQVLLGKK